ncbi:MAG: UxaA family hydrolase [Alphaproteobacteria bacterium]|nr:UxaA family hydrolase [Alphaproteobacteria bacterium]
MAHAAIVLASSDNVGVVTADVRPGSDLLVADRKLEVRDPIPFGHKIALTAIAPGVDIVKFGVPIGRAKAAIAPGEHVHVHNIESTYINNAIDNYEA